MREFIIDFDDKPIIREWRDENGPLVIETATRSLYVTSPKKEKPFILRFATTIRIYDETVALMFYLTFRDSLIHEKAEMPERAWL